jgi:hypothetical protein
VVQDSCHLKRLESRRGRLKYRECVRGERWLYDLLAGNPEVQAHVERLLGPGRVAPPAWIRGLYPVFPSDRDREKAVEGHVDTHAFQVSAVLYLDRVELGGGGFTVWPGSHLAIAQAYRSRRDEDPRPEFPEVVADLARRIAPVEISGEAGTLILCHQRLLHAAGINRSRRVRQAMLCDFRSIDFASFRSEPHGGDFWRHWGGEEDASLVGARPSKPLVHGSVTLCAERDS